VRTFDLAATLLHEDFEGYRDLDELLESWSEVDSAGIGTLSLEFDPYSAAGQRQHPRFTIDNTSGSPQTVRLQSVLVAYHGYWIPGNVSASATSIISARYRCSAGLAGATVTAFVKNSIITGTASVVVTADGEWHEISATYQVFEDSVFAAGLRLELSDIPPGASGTIDFDDLRVRRQEQIEHGIHNSCPVASLRADWEDGYRETIEWPTHVVTANDGTEQRSLLRVMPRWRVEYTAKAADPVQAAAIDAWLWRYQDEIVAVPRWQDALSFASLDGTATVIGLTGGTTTDRWFWPEQRVMLWRAWDDYEAVQVWQVEATLLRLDVNVNQVQGTWDASTLVVPLIPGRLADRIDVRRPNGRTGVVPLTFDLELVSRAI
jgi:hypothetical protein